METLELKHLAPYLPYSLEFNCDFNGIQEMTGLFVAEEDGEPLVQFKGYCADINDTTHKPILRPLSDLTKEIEIDGEKIVISNEYRSCRFNEMSTLKGGSVILRSIMLKEYDIILKYHFDIFGLIEKGLAIDINTLNQ